MSLFAENLKYMMWSRKSDCDFGRVPDAEYPSFLARTMKIDETRFMGILSGRLEPTVDEQARICSCLSIDAVERAAMSDVQIMDVESESRRRKFFPLNIARLLVQLEHGEKEVLAGQLGVNVSTITRWKNGTAMPPVKTLQRIADIFGLESYRDLTDGYLFYSLEPVTTRERRQEIREAIEKLDDTAFEMMYPAFRRLVKG